MERLKTLILAYETEEACRERLVSDGFADRHAGEIASYLAQSTDLAPSFPRIEAALAERGIAFAPCPIDEAPGVIGACDPRECLLWTLTDGIAYFRGSVAPAMARLTGLPVFGADGSLHALCQDKFRSGAVLGALGLPVPAAGLARDGRWLVAPPPSGTGWFVKPNRLGAKIGIWEDSHCRDAHAALDLSRRIHAAYRDDAIVQPYVPGRNVRASFLAVSKSAGMEALGVSLVESGGDFQTMADSLALYGDTGALARAEARYAEPELGPLADSQPGADTAIRRLAGQMTAALGLRDVFSLDLRVSDDDVVSLIEFEICPGLPCFDFRAYCRDAWGMSLEDAMAAAAAARLGA